MRPSNAYGYLLASRHTSMHCLRTLDHAFSEMQMFLVIASKTQVPLMIEHWFLWVFTDFYGCLLATRFIIEYRQSSWLTDWNWTAMTLFSQKEIALSVNLNVFSNKERYPTVTHQIHNFLYTRNR